MWTPWHQVGSPFRALLRFIGPVAITDPPPVTEANLDWLLGLSLYAVICVAAARFRPESAPGTDGLFWNGLALLFLPLAIRIAAPTVARTERVWLLLVLAECTFALKFLTDPSGFVQFDEFLHWKTAQDLLTTQHLFSPNPLLPVSPFYPGLELVTTALVNLSGLSVFLAATMVIILFRAVFIVALFAFYDRLSGSARLAGIASLIYMGNSGYILFNSQFAYESLAVVFMAVAMLAEIEADARRASLWRTVAMTFPLLCAVAVTHHITGYFIALFFCSLVLLTICSRRPQRVAPMLLVAGGAAASMGLWQWFIGNPTENYLGPMVIEGAGELVRIINGSGPPRQFFSLAEDVITAPKWLQYEGIAWVLILAVLLAGGFFSSCARASASPGRAGWFAVFDLARRRWHNSRLLVVSLLAFGWPLSVAMRLTVTGWQVGNRMAAFAFVGVGMVAAFGVAQFWRTPQQHMAALLAGGALTLISVGGAISGWGVAAVRSRFVVEGDALSIEPMGIDAARWARRWLGPGNGFVADRDNTVLLATYGRQDIITAAAVDPPPAFLFLAPMVWQPLIDEITQAQIDYLLVDMRMTTHRPYLSMFFEPGEPTEIENAPLEPEPLQKWDEQPGVSRVFDDGWIRIYDVRKLHHAS